jgi:hypothetical protein
VLDLIDWDVVQVTALDVSGWNMGLKGWKHLAAKLERTNALHELVLSNCRVTAGLGEWKDSWGRGGGVVGRLMLSMLGGTLG